MQMKWWWPLVALPVGLVALIVVGAAVNPAVAARMHHVLRDIVPHGGSTLKMDDGEHVLYVAWTEAGVQEASIDDDDLPPETVSVADELITIRGAKDAEGWPLYEQVPISEEARLRTLPGDPVERLCLRLAAQPDADGGWPLRADLRPMGRDRERQPGPAQAAGVQPGDVLLAVDGTRPATREALRAALEARRGDEALPLLVRRNGAELELVAHPLALTGANFWVYEMQEIQSQAHARSAAQGTDTSR